MSHEDIEDFNIELQNVKYDIMHLVKKLENVAGSMRSENDLLSAIDNVEKAIQHSIYIES